MKGYVVFALLAVFFAESNGLTCWETKCRECPVTVAKVTGTEIKCNPIGLVTEKWLDQVDQMVPYSPLNSTNETFACVKMVALDPKIGGDSTDIISGCMSKNYNALCSVLQDLQMVRGKTEFKCEICENDLCNGAPVKSATLLFAIISVFFFVKSALM